MSDPPPSADRTQMIPRRDVDAALPPGHRLQELVVETVLGSGGHSIVYRVRDERLDRVFALKEYMPATIAQRDAAGVVMARSPRHQPTYRHGLRAFFDEARLLASFDHPALVKVLRVWADNGTAYLLMPLLQGSTLRDALNWRLRERKPMPDEAWVRRLAVELTEALGTLHAQNCLHRDVAPDNVLLLGAPGDGPALERRPQPLLLDFGSARRVIGDATQQLTVLLKSGYSPIEQYEGEGSTRQGPWTDVYALAAVLYTTIAGRVPPSAVARAVKDELVPAAQVGAGRYGAELLDAIDAGLALRPEDRPQTMAAFRERLQATFPKTVMVARKPPAPAATAPAPAPAPARAAPPPAASPAGGTPRWQGAALRAAGLVLALAAAGAAAWRFWG